MALKTDRRATRRRKSRYGHKGTPWTKVRVTTEAEVRARQAKRRRRRPKKGTQVSDNKV